MIRDFVLIMNASGAWTREAAGAQDVRISGLGAFIINYKIESFFMGRFSLLRFFGRPKK